MTKLSRRQFIAFLGAITAPLILHGCRSTPPLTIAAHPWPGYELMFLARSMGWFPNDTVRLIETPSATASLQAVRDGKADGVALTLDEVLRARAEGLPLTIVLVFDVSAGADAVVARPGITAVQQLAGKRIGVERTGLGEFMLQMVLNRAGLQEKDVSILTLTPDRHSEALKQGKIDAALTYEPFVSRLQQDGMSTIFDSRQIPGMILDVLAIRTDILASRSESGRRLVAGHFRALQHFKENLNDASYRMAARLHLPPAKVIDGFRGLELPDVYANRRFLSGGSPQIISAASGISNILVNAGLIDKSDNFNDLSSPRLLPSGEAQ